MDCEMPEMDGFAASKLIRQSNSSVYILGVTGNNRDSYIQKAKENGMNDLKTKPLQLKELLAIILKFCD